MKFTVSALREWISIDPRKFDAIVDRWNSAGLEVESVERAGDDAHVDINITANRGDLMSLAGVARETAALMGLKYRELKSAQRRAVPFVGGRVKIEAGCGCLRYLGAELRAVTQRPSDPSAAHLLESCGLSAINHAVDATNLVMLKLGQPLHAFDLDKLAFPIEVRRARKGEKIAALDGKTYELTGQLVIADRSGPVALAGVIGGAASAVTAATQNIFLECALFDPAEVRRSARALGVHTDSSARFERGIDPARMEDAWRSAADLILAGGGTFESAASAGRLPKPLRPIDLGLPCVEEVLGARIAPAAIKKILSALGCRVKTSGKAALRVTPPSWRRDLLISVDLIEEIARVYGLDRLPSTLPPSPPVLPESARSVKRQMIRRAASGLGLNEAVLMSFIGESHLRALGFDPERAVAVQNPLSSDASHLKPTPAAGLLTVASHNIRHGAVSVRFYEIGPCFSPGDRHAVERTTLGVVMWGARRPVHFSSKPETVDLYDIKAALVAMACAGNPHVELAFEPASRLTLGGSSGADVRAGGTLCGGIEEVGASVAKTFDLPASGVFIATLDLTPILTADARTSRSTRAVYKPLDRFPAVSRDLSMIFPSTALSGHIRSVIQQLGLSNLRRVDIFDRYEGKGVTPGTYALGLTLVFRADDRTLSDDEVNAQRDRAFAALAEKFNAQMRT